MAGIEFYWNGTGSDVSVRWSVVRHHELDRQRLVSDVRHGRVAAQDVQRSSRRLIQAAEFHGQAVTSKPCPLCGQESLRLVLWIYGEAIADIAGTARSQMEIENIVKTRGPVTVHEVEVCTACRWNVLVREFLVADDLNSDRATDVKGVLGE